MSFGDPNNPYAQQPQGGQPGYGYPQQAPQGGYGYPQQPQAYPGVPGYPGSPMPMPGGVKGARVILYILGILQALAGVVVVVLGAVFASEFTGSGSSSSDAGAAVSVVFVIVGIVLVGISLWPILTAAKLGKGRGGVRVSGIIYGSLQTAFALLSVITNAIALSDPHMADAVVFSMLMAVVSLGLGLWIVIGLANSAASAYFKRPLY
ncbi:hypothetical protein SAVIM338S_04518 [Streptomyces avidinii]